jgi:hypothetical protein
VGKFGRSSFRSGHPRAQGRRRYSD